MARNWKPVECPACGHDGIERSLSSGRRRLGRAASSRDQWRCRLCAYEWGVPAASSGEGITAV